MARRLPACDLDVPAADHFRYAAKNYDVRPGVCDCMTALIETPPGLEFDRSSR